MPTDSKDKILRELMERYGTDLLRLCCMYLRDYQLAEDAVQDTFIKVYRGLDQFRGDAPVKTWIIRIAVNTCKNIIRTRWFRMERQELPETVHAPLPDMEQRTDVGKDLLDTPYADKKPEAILYTTDAETNEQIKITSYIVNYAWNTPVNLEIDIAISPEQLNGFSYDFLGYYEFVEQYTSVQGWKVNVIGSVGAESYHLMFTADGIRYHLYGGAPLYRLKDVVDSME